MPSSQYYITGHTDLTTNLTFPLLFQYLLHSTMSLVIVANYKPHIPIPLPMPSSQYYITSHTDFTTNLKFPLLFQYLLHSIMSLVIQA